MLLGTAQCLAAGYLSQPVSAQRVWAGRVSLEF